MLPRNQGAREKSDAGFVDKVFCELNPHLHSLFYSFSSSFLSARGTTSLGEGRGGGSGSKGHVIEAFQTVTPTSLHMLAKLRASMPTNLSMAIKQAKLMTFER